LPHPGAGAPYRSGGRGEGARARRRLGGGLVALDCGGEQ
jgi:hypothetical protein